MLTVPTSIYRASRLYRGITAPILMEAPKRATKFAANDEWGKVYRKMFGVEKMNQSLSIITGASAGATEAFVVVPFELVKIRLQGELRAFEAFVQRRRKRRAKGERSQNSASRPGREAKAVIGEESHKSLTTHLMEG